LVMSSVLGLLTLAGTARAETKVVLKDVHLCCGQCVKAVAGILNDAGVKGACDQKAKTVTITAADDKAAQKALDALATVTRGTTVWQSKKTAELRRARSKHFP